MFTTTEHIVIVALLAAACWLFMHNEASPTVGTTYQPFTPVKREDSHQCCAPRCTEMSVTIYGKWGLCEVHRHKFLDDINRAYMDGAIRLRLDLDRLAWEVLE